MTETEKHFHYHVKRARKAKRSGLQLTPNERLFLFVDDKITRLERELRNDKAESEVE